MNNRPLFFVMTELEIYNNALDLVGQGSHIIDVNETSKEADLCRRSLNLTLLRALSKFNFSFARKDEVITSDYLLEDVVSLPYAYTYSLPADCQKVLYLAEVDDTDLIERARHENIQFNFRVYNGTKVLVTNHAVPFAIHYQANITSLDLLPVNFTEALEYLLASRLALALIHGTTGFQISQQLYSFGQMLLAQCADQDAMQGGSVTMTDGERPLFIRARS